MAEKTYRERVETLRNAWECRDIASEADAELAACRLRIAELEKDATRYRWLRKGGYPIGNFTEEAIDAAIDAAALNSKKESST